MKDKYIDLTGQRFEKLVVLYKSEEKTASRVCVWLCKCDCGKQVLASTCALNLRTKKSCGCLRIEAKHFSSQVLRISGMNRLDSSQCYIYSNYVPCCSVFSTSKLGMDVKDFKECGIQVYNYWAKNG